MKEGTLTKFTESQLENWKAYEVVRRSGAFNMFSNEARILTGLTHEEYAHVMKNYTDLEHEARS